MAINFSAEQYEDAFIPHRLQNWQIPIKYPPQVPSTRSGFTEAIGSGKGYLKPGISRSNVSPWGSFVGTWDMPLQIPGSRVTVSTSRCVDASRKLVAQKEEADFVLSGRQKSLKDRHPLALVDLPECYRQAENRRKICYPGCSTKPQAAKIIEAKNSSRVNQNACPKCGQSVGCQSCGCFCRQMIPGHAGIANGNGCSDVVADANYVAENAMRALEENDGTGQQQQQ